MYLKLFFESIDNTYIYIYIYIYTYTGLKKIHTIAPKHLTNAVLLTNEKCGFFVYANVSKITVLFQIALQRESHVTVGLLDIILSLPGV